jgi:ATP-binding cassette, subfamily B, bacterial
MADSGTQITDDRRTTLPEGGEALSRPKGRSLKPLALLWPYIRRHWITVPWRWSS